MRGCVHDKQSDHPQEAGAGVSAPTPCAPIALHAACTLAPAARPISKPPRRPAAHAHATSVRTRIAGGHTRTRTPCCLQPSATSSSTVWPTWQACWRAVTAQRWRAPYAPPRCQGNSSQARCVLHSRPKAGPRCCCSCGLGTRVQAVGRVRLQAGSGCRQGQAVGRVRL